MNDRVHTVVGVLPNIPQYPAENDVYMPRRLLPVPPRADLGPGAGGRAGSPSSATSRPGVDLRAANAELAGISASWQQDHPADYPKGQGLVLEALSLREELTANARPTLLVLLAAAAFLLLIVCSNVANLTLARIQRRERELAVRTALGASAGAGARTPPGRERHPVGGGGLLGLGLAAVTLDLLVAFVARLSTRAVEVRLDMVVLAFNLVVSVGTGVLVGAPAGAAPRRATSRAS